MDFLPEKLVRELSWRLDKSSPDWKNSLHVVELKKFLLEKNYPENFVVGLINNLKYGKNTIIEKKIKSHKDADLIKKLGGKNLPDEVITKIGNGKYKDSKLSAGSGNTYNTKKKKYTYNDLKKEIGKNDKLFITTAGTVLKVRSNFGERICQLSISKAKNPKDTYMGQISILYKLSKLSKVEVVNKVAPGIGYEKMQIENIDNHMSEMLGKSSHKPLPLFIAGEDTGIDIDGGAKVSGSPKADLAFGIKGKPNFFVSYKHGDYVDEGGKELPASYQQYGSLKTFYTKDFNSAFKDDIIGTATDKFLDDVASQIKKDGSFFPNATGLKEVDGKIVVLQGDKETPTDWTVGSELWKSNYKRFNKIAGSGKNLYVMDKSGWAVRRSLLKVPGGEDISLLAIFGKDYASGKAGINNCNILMQDSVAFTVSLMTDEDGNGSGVNMEVSNKGHIMWNPKMYGKTDKFPKFAKPYEPHLVARYTGNMNIGWNGGNDYIVGARLLVMPRSQVSGKKDI